MRRVKPVCLNPTPKCKTNPKSIPKTLTLFINRHTGIDISNKNIRYGFIFRNHSYVGRMGNT